MPSSFIVEPCDTEVFYKEFGNNTASITITQRDMMGHQKFGSVVQARLEDEVLNPLSSAVDDFDDDFEAKLEAEENSDAVKTNEMQKASATILMGDRQNRDILELMA